MSMKQKPAVIRLDSNLGMSAWEPMTLVGESANGKVPMERFHRVHETVLSAPCAVRAGLWQAEAYSERLENYPYDEIVFVVEGAISIVDEDGNDERFEAGDCFFLQRGFNGCWNQQQDLKIFHMTVAPQ
jgi:uncharacterized cupin superfamily protein